MVRKSIVALAEYALFIAIVCVVSWLVWVTFVFWFLVHDARIYIVGVIVAGGLFWLIKKIAS